MAIIDFGTSITTQTAGPILFEPTLVGNRPNEDNSKNNDTADLPNTSVDTPNKPVPKELPTLPPQSFPHPISGTVWGDINNNGIKDSEDLLLNSIKVDLYLRDNLENPVSTAITDDDGHYEFKNIVLNHYLIKVNLPKGYTLLSKCNHSLINSKTLLSDIIFNDTENINILIGLTKCFSIRGFAFLDLYNHGIYKKSSQGINDLTLNLYDEHDKFISSTTTSTFMASDGYFEFSEIIPGKYRIIFDIPKIILISNPKHGYFGSKANPNTNSIDINITDHDISNAYIGFKVIHHKKSS